MARHYVAVPLTGGLDPVAVTTGTASTGLAIEVSTLDGAGLTKNDVLNALEVFAAYFTRADVPA